MPQARKPVYKKKSNFASNLSSVAKVAGTALSIAKFAKSMLNVEIKSYNTEGGGAVTIGPNGQLWNMCTIPQGDTAYQRDGGQVKITSTNNKFLFTKSSSVSLTTIRAILVVDREGGSAWSGSSELLASTSAAPNAIVSAYYLKNMLRFRVLADKTISLTDNAPRKLLNIYHKYKGKSDGLHVRFEDGGNVPTSNSIYLLLIHDQATFAPTYQHYSRTRFIDN